MKTPNFIVRIPEPCHEDWNSMQPDAKGKFCNSCSKSVFDFSNKTDTEIKDILLEYKDQKVCGHFKKSQVNRPLSITINLKDLPKNISITKAFAIALFLVFGTFLFSCTDEHGQKVSEINVNETEVVEPIDPKNYMVGMMEADIPSPPIDSISEVCSVMTGDTIITIENEEHVDGGISIEEIPLESVPVMDTVNLEEVVIEEEGVYLTGSYLNSGGTMTGAVSVTTICSFVSQNDSTANKELNQDASNSKNALIIYPNPSTGEFTIRYNLLKRANVRLEIFNVNGLLIKTIADVTNQYEGKYQIPVNLSELPNGIYLVSLINNDKKSVERLVIER